ncbi:MAG: toxin [Proteobacteria bacterium]|nr:toxin [Pseudomonadota bacterium]
MVVVGTSGSGKSTLAQKLAVELGHACIDLDDLHWGPAWTPKPEARFHELVATAAAASRWVIAGNYGKVRDLVWPRATCIVWLNYSFATVMTRSVRRSIRRIWRQEALFAGNRETFQRTFLSRDSILLWVISTFARRRREMAALRAGGRYGHLVWIECRAPRDADAVLARCRSGGPASAP